MDLVKRLRRMACRHVYGWSEHRHADVCYNCGQVRPAEGDERALVHQLFDGARRR